MGRTTRRGVGMNAATYVKRIDGWRGDAALYHLNPPTTYMAYDGDEYRPHETSFVIVSAVVVYGEPETYIFPADAEGECLSFGELEGSQKGTLQHGDALRDAGYEIVQISA